MRRHGTILKEIQKYWSFAAICFAALTLSGLIIRTFFAQTQGFLYIIVGYIENLSETVFDFTFGIPFTLAGIAFLPQPIKDISFSYFLIGSSLLNALGPTYDEVLNRSGGTFLGKFKRLRMQKFINSMKGRVYKFPRFLRFVLQIYFYINMYVFWPRFILDMLHDPWVVRWKRDDGHSYRLIIPKNTENPFHPFDRIYLIHSIRKPFFTRVFAIFATAAIFTGIYVGFTWLYINIGDVNNIIFI